MISKISTYESYSEGFDDIVSELQRARKLKQEVSLAFTVTFSEVIGVYSGKQSNEVGLFRDRGIRLTLFEEKSRELGGLIPTLRDYSRRRLGVMPEGSITRLEMHLFKTP